jgi:hypothetical protein
VTKTETISETAKLASLHRTKTAHRVALRDNLKI